MWLSLIVGLLKIFPALRGILHEAIELDRKRNEAEAQSRLEEKDRIVADAVASAQRMPAPAPEQQPKTDSTSGLPASRPCCSGLGDGSPSHDKPA